MMKKYLMILAGIIVLASSCNQRRQAEEAKEPEIAVGEQSDMDNKEAADLLIAAMVNNRLQAALAQLAGTKSKNQRLTSFADLMLQEHEETQVNLQRLSTAYRVEPPEGLTPEAQSIFDQVNALTGQEFDRRFLELMIRLHHEDIDRINAFLTTSPHIMERGVLEQVQQTLTRHLNESESIYNSIKS